MINISFKRQIEEIEIKRETLRNSIFTEAEMLTVHWETKPEIIEKILPPPLEPIEIPLVSSFIAYYPKTNQGQPYYESALFIRSKYKEELGNYFLAMHVDDDRAMIGGREICGFPKKMANISLKKDGTKIFAFSERLGTRYVELKVDLSETFNDSETPKILQKYKVLPSRKKGTINYNFKFFPSPDKTGFDYNPRLVRQETLIKPISMEMGNAEIILKSSNHDPWSELEVVKTLGALYLKTNNIMLPGNVITEVDPTEFLPYSFIKLDWY